MKMPTLLITAGHAAEGVWTHADHDFANLTFEGELICGPHDEHGGHTPNCLQCGMPFESRACGPTHAIVAHGRATVDEFYHYGVRRHSDGAVVQMMSRRQAEHNAERHFDLGGTPVRAPKGTTDWVPYVSESQGFPPTEGT